MVHGEFKEDNNNYFLNKKKKNLNNWNKYEEKRKKELIIFLNECSRDNNDVIQNIETEQHGIIKKNNK